MEHNQDKHILNKMNGYPNPSTIKYKYTKIDVEKLSVLDIGKEVIVFMKYPQPICGTYHMDFMIKGIITNINDKNIYIHNSIYKNIKTFIKTRLQNNTLFELHIKI